MRDERRPGLDGPGRMVKSRGLDGKISYLTKIWGFAVENRQFFHGTEEEKREKKKEKKEKKKEKKREKRKRKKREKRKRKRRKK